MKEEFIRKFIFRLKDLKEAKIRDEYDRGYEDAINQIIEILELEGNKDCVVNLDKPMASEILEGMITTATSGPPITICGQCKKMRLDLTQDGYGAGDYCKCINSQTILTR